MYTIAEALILLATDDDKGTKQISSMINYGLSAAVLAELLYKNKLEVDKKKLYVKDDTLNNVSFFDTVIQEVSEKKTRNLEYWIRYFASKKDRLIEPLYLSLVEKGILKEEEETSFLIFNRTVYPTSDERAEIQIRKQVNDIVLNGTKSDKSLDILLCLIKACSLTREVFGKENKKEANKFIKEIEKNNELAKLISKSISNLQAQDVTVITTTTP